MKLVAFSPMLVVKIVIESCKEGDSSDLDYKALSNFNCLLAIDITHLKIYAFMPDMMTKIFLHKRNQLQNLP